MMMIMIIIIIIIILLYNIALFLRRNKISSAVHTKYTPLVCCAHQTHTVRGDVLRSCFPLNEGERARSKARADRMVGTAFRPVAHSRTNYSFDSHSFSH